MKLLNITWNYLEKNPVVILLFGCTLLVIHALFAHGGCFENDDFVYAYYAVKGVHATTPACYLCDHFALRWVPIFFTSFFYLLFGISEFTSSLFSLGCLLITAITIYAFLSKEKAFIILSAFILFFFNYNTILYAHRLVADTGVLAFNFIAWYFYYRQRFLNQKQTFVNALIFSIAMMLAIISKETVIVIFPFWVILVATDFYKKRMYAFWLKAIMLFIVFTTIYLLWFYAATGDFLYRYHLLYRDNYLGGEAFAPYRGEYLGRRLFYQLWQAFLLNGDMQYVLFAVVGLIYHKSIFNEPRKKLLLLSFGILLLSCNFMSYSLTEYIPLWSDPRQYLFLMPFSVLTGVYVLEVYMREPVKYTGVLLCFAVADFFLFYSELGGTKYVYYGMTAILFLRWILVAYRTKPIITFASYTLFTLVMSANYFYDFFFTRYSFYYDQEAVVARYFRNTEQQAVVYVGDQITTGLGDYLLSFKNERVRFANVDTCSNFSSDTNTKNYLLLNGGYNGAFAAASDSLISTAELNREFRLIDHINSAELYEVKNPAKLEVFKRYSTSKY